VRADSPDFPVTQTQGYSTLRTERDGRVMTVTFDHPPINLMDRAMLSDLRALLTFLQGDQEICAVVFKSAVPDFFIAHADLSIFLKNDRRELPKPEKTTKLNFIHALFEGYRTLPKATIAVIEGKTNGAGTEFALSLDMQFAALGRATIGQFEVALGCLPGGTGTQRLPPLIGRSRTLEMIFGCDELDAKTAELYGVVNRAIATDEIGPFVDRLAGRIASFPLEAIALSKQSADNALPDPVPGLHEESYLASRLMISDEVRRRFTAVLARGAQTSDGERNLAALLPQLGEAQ
jgi:enoyl-CoA hydratase/carnithine racemase